MDIKAINNLSFTGMWEPINRLKKETGIYNRNKVLYTLNELTYHPYVGETESAIAEQVKKYSWGRSFSLWDKFDNHHKCDLIQMNRVKLGERININDKELYTAKGWHDGTCIGITDEEQFMSTYTNEAYSPFDIHKMSPEYIEEVAARHFDVKS